MATAAAASAHSVDAVCDREDGAVAEVVPDELLDALVGVEVDARGGLAAAAAPQYFLTGTDST
jgi:hypothetical protein